jgi:hypothetical protein
MVFPSVWRDTSVMACNIQASYIEKGGCMHIGRCMD